MLVPPHTRTCTGTGTGTRSSWQRWQVHLLAAFKEIIQLSGFQEITDTKLTRQRLKCPNTARSTVFSELVQEGH